MAGVRALGLAAATVALAACGGGGTASDPNRVAALTACGHLDGALAIMQTGGEVDRFWLAFDDALTQSTAAGDADPGTYGTLFDLITRSHSQASNGDERGFITMVDAQEECNRLFPRPN